MYTIIINKFINKALLSLAEGLRSNGTGVSKFKTILCTFLRANFIFSSEPVK